MSDYILCLAGEKISFRPRFNDTLKYFRTFGNPANVAEVEDNCPPFGSSAEYAVEKGEDTAEHSHMNVMSDNTVPVCIPEPDWQSFLAEGLPDDAHTEYSALTPYFSDALIFRDRVILHAVAIRWRDWAYLICAASGTGKSTQARFLQELRPGEFSVICGDRPILQFLSSPRDNLYVAGRRLHAQSIGCIPFPGQSSASKKTDSDALHRPNPFPVAGRSSALRSEDNAAKGVILVHPSPWNGKENWHGADTAPLAGLILLERGEENSLVALKPWDAVLPLYAQFIQTAWDPEKIQKIAELETYLIQSVPTWKLTSYQVPDSTRLLLETVFS